ncbi:MAG: ABC transporter permease, partial [Pirellulales bacterium]|nr:ABC transporter permease [Pirellulales bacterium]
VAALMALIPYSLALHFNDYRQFEYSGWQITNWAWTMLKATSGHDITAQATIIGVVVALAFFVMILLSPQLFFPRRIATPKRVKSAMQAEKLS